MIEVYYDDKIGRVIPDGLAIDYCTEKVQMVDFVDTVGSEFLLMSYRYAMKINNIPHDSIRFHFEHEYYGHNTIILDEDYNMQSPEGERFLYPDLNIKMMLEFF
ncbi:hypothetical protein pEaSNUABM50_00361 [Erwinia phage pEa_SNUABM_50]|uniref:Uncharacterized protein n=2 Tax=Eneladusvirus BF TaxID=2560751 RepID=A0A7L8ZPF9_9CAUD|nr:hypothetical protein pEaSNUABM12_00365 [Erwinia phage pEa_SNUABM_12]QOI72385.1 hypothetical protein pEaSNUABM50_00361 [Erwinia phage pEa_SNUABM_50]QXO11512.1 hypothetical protein pEaSNUABM19_00366 [Erwinia phage pEa_SNUABM_19]